MLGEIERWFVTCQREIHVSVHEFYISMYTHVQNMRESDIQDPTP
jgi:hypothetical protein